MSFFNTNIHEEDMNAVNLDFSSSSIYRDLQNLISLEELIRDREELLRHKDTLSDTNGIENVDELLLHGVTEEEVKNINRINENVKMGKDLLIKTLREYDSCKDELYEINKNIDITQSTIKQITQQLQYLSSLLELNDITKDVIRNLLDKQETIISDLQSKAGLLICKRDKLEAIIRSLGHTYNIIKNAPIHHTCPICITHEVDVYLEPCGHTLCKYCNKNTYCHMCRTKIRTTKNIYYS
jgi:hypothetical protein